MDSRIPDRLHRVGTALTLIAAIMLVAVACKTLTSTPMPQTPAQRVAAAEVVFTHTVNAATEFKPLMTADHREALGKSFHAANALLEEAHWYITQANDKGAEELIPLIYREIELANKLMELYEGGAK
jgi:hypothetical protein